MSRQSGPRNLPGLFWAVAVFFIAVLVWLGWTTIQLDRELALQRTRERLQRSAESLAGAFQQVVESNNKLLGTLQQALQSLEWDDVMRSPDFDHADRVLLSIDETEFRVFPENALRYTPVAPDPPEEHPLLREADRYEFSELDPAAALRLLAPLVESATAASQAGVLLRVARIQKRLGNTDAALATYNELSRRSGEYVGGIPAPWFARYARCNLYEETLQYDSLGAEAVRLVELLRGGGYTVDRDTYSYYASMTGEWIRASGADSSARDPFELPDRHPLSEAALSLHDISTGWRRGVEDQSGIRTIETAHGNVLVQWHASENQLVGLLTGERRLRKDVIVTASLVDSSTTWFIVDGAGRTAARTEQPVSPLQASYTYQVAGNTWTVSATGQSDAGANPRERTRRLLLLLGLVAAVALVSVSMYYVTRALRRELEVARLQSEFVSAVSHEFRTPLTSIRQLTEMLRSGRIRSEDRTEAYLEILDREARRLNRLVESLLNFGRAEAGLHPYEMKPTSIEELVRATVDEYVMEQGESGPFTLDLVDDAILHVDRPTMSLVIWNLVDNARKYSSGDGEVTIRTVREGRSILISVEDEGIGIADEDKKRIFDKFVRVGSDSAPGTGIGLALVRRIVDDHDGAVHVESTPGQGSTFTVRLPLASGEAKP